MQISSNPRSLLRRSQGGKWLALLAICFGWTLALSHAAEQRAGQLGLDTRNSESVHIDAELRTGEPAPAPAADVAQTQARMRALNARIRLFPSSNHHQLAGSGNASAAWLAAFALPLRLLVRGPATSGAGAKSAHRVIARSWPLPRSSCSDSDPDADATRLS